MAASDSVKPADTGSVEKEIATIIRQIDSEVQSIHKDASKAKQNGIVSASEEILYKHLTNLKLRINYLYPKTFDSLEIVRQGGAIYNSPFSTKFKGILYIIN